MKDKLPDLVAHIQKEHSYDVPEVIAVKASPALVPIMMLSGGRRVCALLEVGGKYMYIQSCIK